METGAVPLAEIPGGLDLQATLESGQTYHWRRADGRTYASSGLAGGEAWYETVLDGEVIRARQRDGRLEWEATCDAVPYLRETLRLADDLEAIAEATARDELIEAAYDAYWGLRITGEPFFRTLIAFICSAQMRTERIFGMQRALAEAYGATHTVDGRTYHAFPMPAELADASEADLRELKLGYRAPYVQRTAEMVATGELTREDIPEDYEAAREALTGYVGVGEKVADCVLLFSQGYLEAVPLDTWIRTAIEEHYPHCEQGSYAETSRAIRAEFGPYAGYTQTYVFHWIRAGKPDSNATR